MAVAKLSEPLKKYKWRVEITSEVVSLKRGGYNKVSGLGNTVGETEYREGGESLFVHQLPGLVRGKDVTLSRGMMEEEDFWNLHASVFGENTDYRFNMIVVLQHSATGEDVRAFLVKNCFVKEYSVEDLDAVSNDILNEVIIIKNEGIFPIKL